jgi:GT2 family glycosyltransferase
MEKTLVVLCASYNRRSKTVRALRSLFESDIPGWQVVVELVDAGSSDGTRASVAAEFGGRVNVSVVPSSFYWAQAMRVGWTKAVKREPDAFLWLNDDVILDPDALRRLSRTAESLGEDRIIVGSTRDGQVLSYGGYRRGPWWNRLRLALVVPDATRPIECDTINGNIVWVPASLDSRLAGFPRGFVHAMADLEYGFRARDAGARPVVAPGTFGECPRNPTSGTWQDQSLPRSQRMRLIGSPKHLPLLPWARLALRRGGLFGVAHLVKPYIDVVLSRRL